MLVISTARTIGGMCPASIPSRSSTPSSPASCSSPEPLRRGRDLRPNRLAVIGQGHELHGQGGAARVPAQVPERPQWLIGGQGTGLTFERLLGAATEERQEQIVHRAEVVVDELGLQSGLRRDATGGHRRVALFEHDLLRGVDQGCSGLGRLGADATPRGHPGILASAVDGGRRRGQRGRPQMYIPPLTPITCPVM